MITFFLGGNKSGKSELALQSLLQAPRPQQLLVTGKALDTHFRSQIMEHRKNRPPQLAVQEIHCDLPQALEQARKKFKSILVDSIDYWLFACAENKVYEEKLADLIALLSTWSGAQLFFVSCEIGLGALPEPEQSRLFIRHLGSLNQALAKIANKVYLVVAGLPMQLK